MFPGILFYKLFLWLYSAGAKILSLFNRKAKLWVNGRKHLFKQLRHAFAANTSPVAWFHCASLGEFEQGRPLIEKLKKDYPHYRILVTFFSPSGYEVRKNYNQADWVFYLPLDGRHHARKFLKITKPSIVFFIKYEFWHYYLQEINRAETPLFLVSGLFRASQPFFKWYGGLNRKTLSYFTHFFVQKKSSEELLHTIGIENVTVTGDTRFDRVLATKNNWSEVDKIAAFCGNKKVFVAGSTWEADDLVIKHFVKVHPEMRFIIAPHEVEKDRIEECLKIYEQAVAYSNYDPQEKQPGVNVLVIDNIGMLSRLYNYAQISYVGGAFGDDGIHNVLEPLVFGTPVVFGPAYEKFPEAVDLAERAIGFPVENALEFEQTMDRLLTDDALISKVKSAAGMYVQENIGATEKIFSSIEKYLTHA